MPKKSPTRTVMYFFFHKSSPANRTRKTMSSHIYMGSNCRLAMISVINNTPSLQTMIYVKYTRLFSFAQEKRGRKSSPRHRFIVCRKIALLPVSFVRLSAFRRACRLGRRSMPGALRASVRRRSDRIRNKGRRSVPKLQI